jgi:5-methylcytosine-specific restriction endonuclease McrA
MTSSPPTAEQQITFLHDLQRIFEEGDFSATYKFALLLALAEISVESGDDSGDVSTISLRRVAEKFVELYWRQAAPYRATDTTDGVLFQNLGTQAAVIRHVGALHALSQGKLSVARLSNEWRETISTIARIVREMPLRHLQVVGGEQRQFLYIFPPARSGEIELKAGVVFNLRKFQGFIQQMARSAWVDHVRANSRNVAILGKSDDLEGFMFGSPRADLSQAAELLAGIQSKRCFYCDTAIGGRGVVDHFIPWSRYPRDTAHNFVLAHAACNGDKRELLAARQHLERWSVRNDHYREEIGGPLRLAGFVDDLDASRMVARWAYGQAIGGHAWSAKNLMEPIDAGYLQLI